MDDAVYKLELRAVPEDETILRASRPIRVQLLFSVAVTKEYQNQITIKPMSVIPRECGDVHVSILLCKAKRQHLLTCKVSRCCLLVLQTSTGILSHRLCM